MPGGKGKSIGGKASGAKESGTKTQKSHSAKAGLQVSQARSRGQGFENEFESAGEAEHRPWHATRHTLRPSTEHEGPLSSCLQAPVRD